jgi:hypothetical protein
LVGGFGHRVYNFIGHNRDRFGLLTSVTMPWRKRDWKPGLTTNAIAAVFILIVLSYNVSSVPSDIRPVSLEPIFLTNDKLLSASSPFIELARLDQRWNMFAPYPQKNDGWFLMVGLTQSGALVDVLRQSKSAPPTGKPHKFIPEQAKNYRWRKYLTRIKRPGYEDELGRYAGAACARWNKREAALGEAGDALDAFNIYYVQERTPKMGETLPVKYLLLWRHDCFDASRLEVDRVRDAMLKSEL